MAFLVYVMSVFSGPFGTFNHVSLMGRAVCWAPVVVLALGVSGLSCMIVRGVFPDRVHVAHALITAGLFVVIYSPLLFVIIALGLFGTLPLPFAHVFATVVAFACVVGIWSMVFSTHHAPDLPVADSRPRLYGRLPAMGARRVARITVQDHYVDVRLTDGSSNRLLMRFSDAVNEMDDADGFCTHRSHWVTREAVEAAIKDGAKEFVILTNGERIPVSKTYRENLVLAGFL